MDKQPLRTPRVLHVCFSDNVGGAYIGAHRLHTCMRKCGVDSRLLVIKKRTNDPMVIPSPFFIRLQNLLYRILSRLILALQRAPDKEFRSLSLFPTTIHRLINKVDCDVIQLHWVSNNTIGLNEYKKLNKPIVWKLPDMWPFCGTEHYTSDDRRYTDGYTPHNRPAGASGLDIDRWGWSYKQRQWKTVNMTIVCPSKWLYDCASRSLLFRKYPVHHIPNPIDTDLFKPSHYKSNLRNAIGIPNDKNLILFTSLSRIDYPRKGYNYLKDALFLFSQHVDVSDYTIVFMGRDDFPVEDIHGFNAINVGLVLDMEMLASIYAAMDITVVPSEADNLPNVIKESMACGVPCVAFDVGGIGEMISHKQNGYLACAGDVQGLADGLSWYFNTDRERVDNNARNSAVGLHGYRFLVDQYIDIYRRVLGRH